MFDPFRLKEVRWREGLHSIFIILILMLMTGAIAAGITYSISANKIHDLKRQLYNLREFTVKKSAMMMSYVEGLEDGISGTMLYHQQMVEDYDGFKKWKQTGTKPDGWFTLDEVRERFGLSFLKRRNIYDTSTSNYITKLLTEPLE